MAMRPPRFKPARFTVRHVPQAQQRQSAYRRGYTKGWDKASKEFLKRNPLCVECGKPATETDHRIPHHGNGTLFWDVSNWQPMCKACHSRKTATEDGGFGNATYGDNGAPDKAACSVNS